ncbi:MAG: GTPase HflX [bacterium]|nr:GTPase HflX [bacterium]MCY3951154.1 GTPase HflX [bacterium]MCY4103756.1 GTPase HflX [bacterium]
MTDPARDRRAEGHRGAFGEFGGEAGGFIDRAFREQIVLVGVAVPALSVRAVEESLEELARLVDTAGADPVHRVIQRRDRIDPATYVGRGKAQQIRDIAEQYDADTVVFDDELSAAQQYNLEGILGRTAIDRTTVILDIFAQNASSTEGKVQVELAQLRYRLPRLRGSGYRLSQQAGGIGTRGPGETQLEVDRRRLLRRINTLESKLRGIRRHRGVQARRRQRSAQSTVAIVGYTNAGKSSLLNALCDSEAHVEDRLFATLDALTRRLDLPGGETVLLVDTVGFVRKLPHEFVEAFMSTLEVAVDADLLVHVVDASAADCDSQLEAVREVLEVIGAAKVPELLVFNKLDAADGVEHLLAAHPGSVAVSALRGVGLEHLSAVIGDRLRAAAATAEFVVPFSRGEVMAGLHRSSQVLSETATGEGMRYLVRIDDASAARFADYRCPAPDGAGDRNSGAGG